MKDLTPNDIALRVSFLVAVVVTFVLFLILFFITNFDILSILIVFPTTFLIAYLGFRIAIEKFIYKKIKLIYRTIHNLKLKKGDKVKEFNFNSDVLSSVKTEVEEWDKTNKKRFHV